MTALVLVGCVGILAWVGRVLAAAGREQLDLFHAARSTSPDDVRADSDAFARDIAGTWAA